jgi:hypothetical protein
MTINNDASYMMYLRNVKLNVLSLICCIRYDYNRYDSDLIFVLREKAVKNPSPEKKQIAN